ncbi:MAG: hypothetical protein ACREAA_08400, partial [Candidatus Polarisedimenticolia bacterium]
ALGRPGRHREPRHRHPATSHPKLSSGVCLAARGNIGAGRAFTFERVQREETLPRFGLKAYRPDFGIPEIQSLIEVKFIGESTNPGNIQEEILADVPGYLASASGYQCLVALIYDATHKLRDPRAFVEALKTVEGIVDVIIVPGF